MASGKEGKGERLIEIVEKEPDCRKETMVGAKKAGKLNRYSIDTKISRQTESLFGRLLSIEFNIKINNKSELELEEKRKGKC